MKLIVAFTFILFLAVNAYAVNTVTYGTVSYYDGLLTKPDTLQVGMLFSPSGLDTSFISLPDSAIWDTTVTITGYTDETVKIVYKLVWGSDTYYAEEKQVLRYSNDNFTTGYFHGVAESSDSGQTLTASEIGDVADSTRALLERAKGYLWSAMNFWGSNNKTTQIFYPNNGTKIKDSVQIVDSLGVVQISIIYKHKNVNTVLDSTVVFHRI
jgi:hypothetical protein